MVVVRILVAVIVVVAVGVLVAVILFVCGGWCIRIGRCSRASEHTESRTCWDTVRFKIRLSQD